MHPPILLRELVKEESLMVATFGPLWGLAMVFAALGTGRAGAPPGISEGPKPLPQQIVTAWKEAGAKVVWLRAERYSYWYYLLPFDGSYLCGRPKLPTRG
jgi:hypothetical protein